MTLADLVCVDPGVEPGVVLEDKTDRGLKLRCHPESAADLLLRLAAIYGIDPDQEFTWLGELKPRTRAIPERGVFRNGPRVRPVVANSHVPDTLREMVERG